MAKCIILIGVPASGKSTWTENFIKKNSDFQVISSDALIDEKCKEAGITYSDGFQKFIGYATTEFKKRLTQAVKEKKNFIVDRTNMSRKSRKQFFDAARGYEFEAVYFNVTESELKRRLLERGEKTGKFIPEHVMKSMASNYDAPTRQEGFSKIHEVRS